MLLFLVALAAAVAWIVTTARRIFGIVIRPAPARRVLVAVAEAIVAFGSAVRLAAGVWPTSRIAVG